MKFGIGYTVGGPTYNEYADLLDAINHADTDGVKLVSIVDFGGHTCAVWKPETGWRVCVNEWKTPEWDPESKGRVATDVWYLLDEYREKANKIYC